MTVRSMDCQWPEDYGPVVPRLSIGDADNPKRSRCAQAKGLTMFFLSMKTARRRSAAPSRQANGASGFNEVYFTDCPYSDSRGLGACGAGVKVSLTTLMGNGTAPSAPAVHWIFPEAVQGSAWKPRSTEACPWEDFSRSLPPRAVAVKAEWPEVYWYAKLSPPCQGRYARSGKIQFGKLVAGRTMQNLAMFALDIQG